MATILSWPRHHLWSPYHSFVHWLKLWFWSNNHSVHYWFITKWKKSLKHGFNRLHPCVWTPKGVSDIHLYQFIGDFDGDLVWKAYVLNVYEQSKICVCNLCNSSTHVDEIFLVDHIIDCEERKLNNLTYSIKWLLISWQHQKQTRYTNSSPYISSGPLQIEITAKDAFSKFLPYFCRVRKCLACYCQCKNAHILTWDTKGVIMLPTRAHEKQIPSMNPRMVVG